MNQADFPMLKKDIVYFNNAATTFKPASVINAINDYYQNYSVNTNRGVDSLSYLVTEKYENVRDKIAKYLATDASKIVFTRGTTDSINFAAQQLTKELKKGDEILVSNEEHHAVFVTFQQLAKTKQVVFKVVDFEKIAENINEKTKIVAISHITNVLGKKADLEKISLLKEKYSFWLVVDGAQAVMHEKIVLEKYPIDFYAFSGHKMLGPTGVGVLYSPHLEKFSPLVFGGEMVDIVSEKETSFKKAPYCFEAGTMMISAVIGLGAAIDYLNNLSFSKTNQHIKEMRQYLIDELSKDDDIIIYNPKTDSSIISFNIKNIHPHDVATFLDNHGFIVRAGHHCASPLMTKLGVSATVRISLAFYNNLEECQKFIAIIKKRKDYLDVIC